MYLFVRDSGGKVVKRSDVSAHLVVSSGGDAKPANGAVATEVVSPQHAGALCQRGAADRIDRVKSLLGETLLRAAATPASSA